MILCTGMMHVEKSRDEKEKHAVYNKIHGKYFMTYVILKSKRIFDRFKYYNLPL